MTLHELKAALDAIVSDGNTEVVIEADEITAYENDLLELRLEYVEKVGGRIIIHAS